MGEITTVDGKVLSIAFGSQCIKSGQLFEICASSGETRLTKWLRLDFSSNGEV